MAKEKSKKKESKKADKPNIAMIAGIAVVVIIVIAGLAYMNYNSNGEQEPAENGGETPTEPTPTEPRETVRETIPGMVDCGEEIFCYNRRAVDCEPVRFKQYFGEQDFFSVVFMQEVRGGTKLECELYVTVDRSNMIPTAPRANVEFAESLIGKEMTCELTTAQVTGGFTNYINKCTGELALLLGQWGF